MAPPACSQRARARRTATGGPATVTRTSRRSQRLRTRAHSWASSSWKRRSPFHSCSPKGPYWPKGEGRIPSGPPPAGPEGDSLGTAPCTRRTRTAPSHRPLLLHHQVHEVQVADGLAGEDVVQGRDQVAPKLHQASLTLQGLPGPAAYDGDDPVPDLHLALLQQGEGFLVLHLHDQLGPQVVDHPRGAGRQVHGHHAQVMGGPQIGGASVGPALACD